MGAIYLPRPLFGLAIRHGRSLETNDGWLVFTCLKSTSILISHETEIDFTSWTVIILPHPSSWHPLSTTSSLSVHCLYHDAEKHILSSWLWLLSVITCYMFLGQLLFPTYLSSKERNSTYNDWVEEGYEKHLQFPPILGKGLTNAAYICNGEGGERLCKIILGPVGNPACAGATPRQGRIIAILLLYL